MPTATQAAAGPQDGGVALRGTIRAVLLKGAGVLQRMAARARPAPADRLLSMALQSESLPEDIAPGSEAGRRALEFWFAVQKMADVGINQTSRRYYDEHHPKHYLWLGHNQYIFDHVAEGDRVLDIGCGGSHYQQWIADKASEVLGVDIRQERVDLARRNNTRDNVHFELMDVTKDLPAGRFDVAVCSHVIEHLDDPVTFLRALSARVPRLIVKVPLEDSHWMKLVKRDIGMFWLDDPDHRREYTRELLIEQLEAGGWDVEEIVRGYDLRATATSRACPVPAGTAG